MTVERTAVETVVDDGLTIPLFRPGIVMSDQRSAQGSPGHLFLFNPRLPYTADRHRYSSAAEPNPSAGWHASVPFMNIEVRRGMRLKLHACPLSHRFLKIISSWIILFVPVPEPNHAFTCSERGIILVTDLMSYIMYGRIEWVWCISAVFQCNQLMEYILELYGGTWVGILAIVTLWVRNKGAHMCETGDSKVITVNFEKITSIAGRSIQRSGQFPYVSSMLDRLHLAVGYQKPETIQ
ncbi:hypothetical protein CIRG_00604 [Coccidioides immitis RMSCC 2394]|uniref:Uncharacterized protein n=1 Tax=Coccidioides immitis RMSCC 2394 TaxID=404692 RepID=A0A0J7AT37_COCIT|nr:hypothetical protein CIRG_00604 [Coccidioides immitis RMSCC 2394]